jgi:KDO2-lipid IV(A) lauroyltransferase
MARKRNKVADYAVYLVVRLVVCVIQALSFRAACRAAGGLAWLLYKLDKRHRLVADDNLRHAFPELTDPVRRDQRVRDVYRHFCLLLMEIIHLPRRLHPQNWRHHLKLLDAPLLVNQLLSGRPLLLITAHFGNWELGGYVLGLLGFQTHAIARALDNEYLDAFLHTFRGRTGQKIVDKHDLPKIEAVLAARGVLATLGDQDAGERGPFVDFFGRPASTHKSIALLALEYGVPMLVIGTLRTQPGEMPPEGPGVGTPLHYAVVIEDLLLPEDFAADSKAVPTITQRFTAGLERLIRRAPEQYFWLHRRWKHQPKAKKQRPAA